LHLGVTRERKNAINNVEHTSHISYHHRYIISDALLTKIDAVPQEILEKILLHLEISPSELFSLSLVSRNWHSTIKNEHFLNKFFHRRLASRYSIPNQFRANRRGNHPIPEEDLGSSSLLLNKSDFHSYSIDPLPTNMFSISCWLWVPNEYRFDLFVQSKLSNQYLGFTIVSSSSCFGIRTLTSGLYTREIPQNDAWTHVVLNTNRNDGTCSLFLNGHECRLARDASASGESQPYEESLSVVHYSEKASSACRLAYLCLFPFCLTQGEIQGIYQHQLSSLDEIKMGTYWAMKRSMN
jgi:hypothetical protein